MFMLWRWKQHEERGHVPNGRRHVMKERKGDKLSSFSIKGRDSLA